MSEKSLGTNALFNVLYRCLNVLFPLVTMVYVSRILMPEGVGKVASAQNVIAYFVIIASLGLPTYGVKKIAEFRDDREKCSRTFTELFVINAISTIICSFIYIIMLFSVDFFQPKIAISLVVGIQLFANVINIDWLYQGYEEFRYIMLRSFFVKLVALISVFIFVRDTSDYIIYALITALSLVANFIFNVAHMHKYVDMTFKQLCIQKHIKPILTLLAASIAIEIYTLCATTFLNILKGDEIVAYFTNSVKAVAVTRTMITAICAVFLPRLNYYIGKNRIDDFNKLAVKGISLLLSMSIPATIILAVLAKDFVMILFGAAYLPSVLSMQILSVSVITVAISNFMGYQILVSLGKEKIVLYSTIIAAIINIILNIVLISPFGHYGAAIASVISEAAVSLYQLYYVSKSIPLKFSYTKACGIILPTAVMTCIMLSMKLLRMGTYLDVILISTIGLLSYCIIGFKFHNDAVVIFFKKLRLIKS